MKNPRYFVVWAKYHDTPDALIDHLHTHGDSLKNIVLYAAHDVPGTLTGSAEIWSSSENEVKL